MKPLLSGESAQDVLEWQGRLCSPPTPFLWVVLPDPDIEKQEGKGVSLRTPGSFADESPCALFRAQRV